MSYSGLQKFLVATISAPFVLMNSNAIGADTSVRVFTGDASTCFVSGQEGQRESIPVALGVAIGSSIIRSSISALGRYLSSAAQSTSSPIMTASGSSDLFRLTGQKGAEPKLESNLECVVVVTGDFSQRGAPQIASGDVQKLDPDGMFLKTNGSKVEPSPALRAVGLNELPYSYFEFKVQQHPTAPAVRLVPSVIYSRMANTALYAQSAKAIEITFTLLQPSLTGTLDVKSATGNSGLVLQLPFVVKQLASGRVKKSEPLPNFDTVWVAAPKSPSEEELTAAKKTIGSTEGTLSLSPSNVFITYREIDQPELVLSFLANALSDNSNQIGGAAEEVLRSMMEGRKK
jgi:hypothetical protein